MGISVSLLLIAAGLVLLIATTLNSVGWILLIVGAIGILLSLIFWSAWGGLYRRRFCSGNVGFRAWG